MVYNYKRLEEWYGALIYSYFKILNLKIPIAFEYKII